MEDDRQDFDNMVWDKSDEAWEESQKQLRQSSTCRQVEYLAEQKFGKRATLVPPIILGGYNVLYRIRLEGVSSSDVMVRFAIPHLVQFPDEKTLREAITTRYIAQNTQVLVPRLFHYGQKSEVGPFIILQHIQNQWTLSHALRDPSDDPSSAHVLNPMISESKLESLYKKVALCLLQLSKLNFPRIGSLAEDSGGSYYVAGRPITQNMNNLIQLANIPHAALPLQDKTYGTADEWYIALAEMHMVQLVFQRNDLVFTEDDCRNKYVARQIFLKLAKQGRLSTFGFAEDNWSAQSKTQPSTSSAPSGSGSFRLWCDDFRAGNILVDESNDILAVIDWEFAYFGPTQFFLDPPWWLLLDMPEMWSSGIDNWKVMYEIRLKTWLSAMKQAEEAMNQAEESLGPDSMPFVLSTHMEQSWETGRFWLNYAARKSWAFDAIFWKYLDERFFGHRNNVPKEEKWKTRIHLLGKKEREAMEPFVKRKMEESKERILADWDPKEAKERLSGVLFD